MSAHCDKCGADLVYTEYPDMECPVCVRNAAIAALKADNERLRGLVLKFAAQLEELRGALDTIQDLAKAPKKAEAKE